MGLNLYTYPKAISLTVDKDGNNTSWKIYPLVKGLQLRLNLIFGKDKESEVDIISLDDKKYPLPRNMWKYLFLYFKEYSQIKAVDNFDCFSFFMYLKWFTEWYKTRLYNDFKKNFNIHILAHETFWLISKSSPGSVFLLLDQDQIDTNGVNLKTLGYHFMISLGDGNFLSKFYNNWPVWISNLEEISKIIPYKSICMIQEIPE